MARKTPHPVDVHVGARIRMRRIALSMSQEDLGDALGLTFQQVQKYEKGTNRVSGSRLVQIAIRLRVTVAYLFEGAPGNPVSEGRDPLAFPVHVMDVLMSVMGQRMVAAYSKIKSERMRRAVTQLVEEYAHSGS